MKLRCIIIDDDSLSTALMEHLCSEVPNLLHIGSFDHAKKALEFLENHQVDLIFLDIEMPQMSGMEMIRTLKERPQVILVTSKKEYAIEAFEEQVADYLVKPIVLARFQKAVQKVTDWYKQNSKAAEEGTLFAKVDGQYINIPYQSIDLITALGDYVTVHTADKRYTFLSTMKDIQDSLPARLFMRIHRSHIISLQKIQRIEKNQVSIGKHQIPIGKSFKKDLMQVIHPHLP